MESNKVDSPRECIQLICMFAKLIGINEEKTPYEIFSATKYAKYQVEITEGKVADMIKQNDSIVEDWLEYSKDKRFTPAWYFSQ